MGNEAAQPSIIGSDSQYKKYLQQIDLQPQTEISPYRQFQIAYLKTLFSQLDPKSSTSIQIQMLDHYYDLRQHPLYPRIRIIFKQQLQKLKQKRLTFDIMLYLLIVFHIKTNIEDKYRFLFRLFDWDKDFKLSSMDLSQTFEILFPGHMYTEDVYLQMGEQFLNSNGVNGFMKFETFMKVVKEDQVKQFMTLKFSQIQ